MIDLKQFSNISWYDWGTMIHIQSPAGHSNMSDIIFSNFSTLDKKVDASMRELDYFDMYRFVGSVNSTQSYKLAYASLPNNRALAVVANFDKYHSGDIILKNDQGQEILIPTKQAGIFVPQYYKYNDVSNPSAILLKYGVLNTKEEIDANQWPIIANYTKITYTDQQADITLPFASEEILYDDVWLNDSATENPHTISLKTDSLAQVVMPVVKIYTGEGEEVSIDNFTVNGRTLTVSVPANCTLVAR